MRSDDARITRICRKLEILWLFSPGWEFSQLLQEIGDQALTADFLLEARIDTLLTRRGALPRKSELHATKGRRT